jgi:hypothetical protein
MSRIGDDITAGLKELEGDMGSQMLTWAGNSYVCVPARSNLGKLLGAGGFAPSNQIGLYVRKASFGETIPTPRQNVIFDGDTLQIVDVTVSPDQSYVLLDCNHPDRGA